jgi:3-keto-5-aminohexanoate cleavage enzyme
MEKLIITVTVDSSMSYPANPYCPPPTQVDAVVEEYVRSVKAGASITHIHGVHKLEDGIQADGKRLSRVDVDGWKRMKEGILSKVDAVMQFGIASARIEQKIELMGLEPDMMSIAFNDHNEHFHFDKEFAPNEIYALHPREELANYSRAAQEHGVKVEVESFHTGAFWNMEYIRTQGLLPDPLWTTLFLGWPGGTWTPPTPKALINFVDHLPERCNWNVSVMDPDTHWQILTLAIILGGHVRVGWEDNPYLTKGEYAKSNVELVEKIVGIAEGLGREVATPEEARQIIGLTSKPAGVTV